jgi:uncharacterized protein (TIGR04562 family)
LVPRHGPREYFIRLPESPKLQQLLTDDLPTSVRRYLFHGGAMRAIIGGQSALDLPRLHVSSRQDAEAFLARYGYELNIEDHVRDIERIRHEAMGFTRGLLLHDTDLKLPDWLDTIDVVELLLTASRPAKKDDRPAELRQAWACGALRVMHAVAHADNFFQRNYYRQIREAVLERFVDQVQTLPDGTQVLADGDSQIPLLRFEVKQQKPLRSVVLKLLQKQENVATDLFDHIGVRIIVRRPIEALMVVRCLHRENTIVYANVKPTRSRNTLVDISAYAERAKQLIEQVKLGALDEQTAIAMLAAFETRPPGAEPLNWNRHSSSRYRAIQFTCRQMIRVRNPLHERLIKARKTARRLLDGDCLIEMLNALSLLGIEPEQKFFFPYEVQIMDIAAHQEATAGRAAYREYKMRQTGTVRERVLKRVLELHDTPVSPPQRDVAVLAPRPLGPSVELS